MSGTVTYHRADYHPATDEPWLVWFTKDQADPYWFTAEQGEAMGLTPPAPAPLVVTCNGHSIELSDEQGVNDVVRGWADVDPDDFTPGSQTMIALARLLRDALQDPQPASANRGALPDCDYCGDAQSVPGAVVLSSPAQDGTVRKYHCCVDCWVAIDPNECLGLVPEPERDDTASGIDSDALPIGTVLRVVELTADGEEGDLYIEQLRDPNAVDVDPTEPAPFATWHPTLVASIKGAMSGYVSGHEQAISAALGVVERWLLRDARQDPQPASEPTYFPDEGFDLVKRNKRRAELRAAAAAVLQDPEGSSDAVPSLMQALFDSVEQAKRDRRSEEGATELDADGEPPLSPGLTPPAGWGESWGDDR